ncbi:STAS domain-containing protein [Actinophytocola sp.]|uniref:STAS domain-containing protein n=1 Tax=Actinophytocola sp. TaxID=1872138 RepID=UPI002D35F8E1|nr:STAS domain-containing protein [Actinophytocola sp.]HYQ64992.1 STAS domain-containing protein [Actinophytocola sp.]
MSERTVAINRRVTANEYLTVRLVHERQDLDRINPVGEIDLCTAPLLREALLDTEDRDVRNVLVDLSRVDFLALAGVHELRAANDRRAAVHLRLVVAAPTAAARRTLSLTEAAGSLEIYLTTSGALSALASPAV